MPPTHTLSASVCFSVAALKWYFGAFTSQDIRVNSPASVTHIYQRRWRDVMLFISTSHLSLCHGDDACKDLRAAFFCECGWIPLPSPSQADSSSFILLWQPLSLFSLLFNSTSANLTWPFPCVFPCQNRLTRNPQGQRLLHVSLEESSKLLLCSDLVFWTSLFFVSASCQQSTIL